MTKEIIIDQNVAKKIGLGDPMSSETLRLEAKLTELEISPDGKIHGVAPIGSANKRLPPNSGHKKIGPSTFILASEGTNTIVVLDKI